MVRWAQPYAAALGLLMLFLQDYAERKNNDSDYHILTIKDER